MHYIIVKTSSTYRVLKAFPSTRLIPAKPSLGKPEQIEAIPAPVVMGAARVLTQDNEPTLDEMKVAFGDDALSIAKKSKEKAIFSAAKTALAAIFSTLPAGPQAQFKPVEDAIVAAAGSGNWTLASEILSTAVVPAELAPAQAALVAALAPFVAKITALAEASTVEQVNAIVTSAEI